MGVQKAITVKDGASSPSVSTWARVRYCSRSTTALMESHSISRIMVFTLALHNILFIGGLTKIRTQMTNDNKSAFELSENGGLMITAIVALFASEVTSGLLFFTNIASNYYTILKFLGIFSSSLAPSLLMMVLDTSHPMLYLLSLVFYAITTAYVCSGHEDADRGLGKSSPISTFTYMGLVLVPLALVLVLFVPRSLDSILYAVLYPIFGMEIVFFFIIYFKFMFIEEKPEAQNLEGIHQDENNLEAQQDKKQPFSS